MLFVLFGRGSADNGDALALQSWEGFPQTARAACEEATSVFTGAGCIPRHGAGVSPAPVTATPRAVGGTPGVLRGEADGSAAELLLGSCFAAHAQPPEKFPCVPTNFPDKTHHKVT
jgi:hypothetical protein